MGKKNQLREKNEEKKTQCLDNKGVGINDQKERHTHTHTRHDEGWE